ncbi:MAG TPA: hypothetical protein VIQ05_20885 [Tardiphaga sp.]
MPELARFHPLPRLSEINEIVRGIPDAAIRSREEVLHHRLKQLAASLPQLKSAWIFDARDKTGYACAAFSSTRTPI